jgi:hypothetical protein
VPVYNQQALVHRAICNSNIRKHSPKEQERGFAPRGMARELRVFTRHHRSATGPRGKGELDHSRCVVNSITGFLSVRIDVNKPAEALRRQGFEIWAVRIEKLKIILFSADAGNGIFTLWFYVRNPNVGGWPAVLRSDKGRAHRHQLCARREVRERPGGMNRTSERYIFFPFP